MNTLPTHFEFQSNTIRVTEIDGEPWFAAIDVCHCLFDSASVARRGATNYLYALNQDEKRKLSREEMLTLNLSAGNAGPRPLNIISESGLYKLIMRSDKPEARSFQDWVTRVVLPVIRKDGGYIAGEEKVATGEMSEDELILKAMQVMQGKVERLREENAGMRTKLTDSASHAELTMMLKLKVKADHHMTDSNLASLVTS